MDSSDNSTEMDNRRSEILRDAVDRFRFGPELAKRVYHLGQPVFCDDCPTASIALIGNSEVLFRFGRRFFDRLGDEKLLFVLFHEALHWAFRHPRHRLDRDGWLWNIACDLVVNEFLLSQIGFGRLQSARFGQFVESAVTFSNLDILPAERWSQATAEETYEALREHLHVVRVRIGLLSTCDQHDWPEDGDPEHAAAVGAGDKLSQQIEKLLEERLSGWGDIACGELRRLGLAAVRPPDWERILNQQVASRIKAACEQRWAPASRKVAWMYPDVLLPGDCEIEINRLAVLLAIDASASIQRDDLQRLISLARTLPHDRVDVSAVSFDTRTYPLDLSARLPRVCGGGGTSFQAIENLARKMSCYPDLVVVLTDGQAPRPKVHQPARWLWLVTGKGQDDMVSGIGQIIRLTG